MLIINDLQKKNAGFWQKKAQKGGFIRNLGYLWAHENMRELHIALAKWFSDDNHWKPHQALGYKTPWECYRPEHKPAWKEAA
jgi:hypothetical protein